MRTIHKCPLKFSDQPMSVMMPAGFAALDVQVQRGVPTLWFLCESTAKMQEMTLYMIGTGWEVPKGIKKAHHIGTTLHDKDGLVYHWFLVPPTQENPAKDEAEALAGL